MTREELVARYNCGPVQFSGNDNALYERHLAFDHLIPVSAAIMLPTALDACTNPSA
jgi:starch phosphorylase